MRSSYPSQGRQKEKKYMHQPGIEPGASRNHTMATTKFTTNPLVLLGISDVNALPQWVLSWQLCSACEQVLDLRQEDLDLRFVGPM